MEQQLQGVGGEMRKFLETQYGELKGVMSFLGLAK